MTALITPVSDVAAALRINHEKTEAAVLQVKYCSYSRFDGERRTGIRGALPF